LATSAQGSFNLTIQETKGHNAVRQVLEALAIAPLANLGQIHGKSLRPLLTEITGLSAGRIAQGNLEKVRPSKIKEIQENATAWTHEQGKKRGWSADEVSALIANPPKKCDGDTGLRASWIKSMEVQDTIRLPYAIARAMQADELFQSLIDACNNHDIDKFKQIVSENKNLSGQPNHNDTNGHTAPDSSDVKWTAISEWGELGPVLNNFLESLIFDIHTALDAEWGCQYFQAMRPMPLFLWVAPRIKEDWDIQSGTKPSRNPIHRPVRRLLELSHALVHRHYRKNWPTLPVGRSELGTALELADAHIGNYFDGTRKLTIDAYASYWNALCRHFSPPNKGTEDYPRCPVPLGVMAIIWQETLIRNTSESKLKSFVLLDEDDYKNRWRRHRINSAGQPSSGDVDWPDWLLNQSVSSDSVRSSQSSGRSSSPRECQYSS